MEDTKTFIDEMEQPVTDETDKDLNYEYDMVLQVANDELEQAYADYEDDESCAEYRNLLHRITNRVLQCEKLVGDADDIHNYSVELARRGEYKLSVEVLKKGLSVFPRNTDLLADLLQYCCSCGEQEECAHYYSKLQEIPQFLWTWRAFSFSIDYIKNSLTNTDITYDKSDYEKKKKEMCALANAYRKAFPNSEDSYFALFEVYSIFGEKSKAQEILEKALAELKVCPRCASKLAEIYFEKGEMSKALENINRGLLDSNQSRDRIDTGYLYLLSGLSKTALLHEKKFVADKKEIMGIYEDFNIALEQNVNDRFKKIIRNRIVVIKTKTSVDVPDKFDRLSDLL